MKNLHFMSYILISGLFFTGCGDFNKLNIDEGCIADIAVTTLNIVGTVTLGQKMNIKCVIRNIIDTTASCTSSEGGSVTVTCAHDTQSHGSFSEYDVFDKQTFDLKSFNSGEEDTDIMEMQTDQGPGYYAMKVEVNPQNDTDSTNNANAFAIRVD